MQARVMDYSQICTSIVPEEYRGELWVYAAGYVLLFTLLMLFRLSTFSFICTTIYVVLISMLVLRFYGKGPLARPG